eukprot:CAMPEP_0174845446 /NCGR_PEP_ID=MMETSP1114-20130205/11726_1 /TAXON_ID=312471 /ORGANISM="Neobodo designis, Strain CCAP 1951/1" /LENGTH=973 /DNA_ID=CAMNT_0016079691 /DNA_START=83 /DNA_END=3004 /DNA_ORIENTATION=+
MPACLIDSFTGRSFTRAELDVAVADWAAKIQTAMPKYFSGDAHMDKDAQAAAKVGGWYLYNALDKSAATVIACLATERLFGAYVLSDFDDRASIIDRVRPVAAFVATTDPAPMPGENVFRIVVDVDACAIKEIVPPSEVSTTWAPERAIDADVKYITFSSGSTGRPKGIYGSHKSVQHMNETRNQLYPYAANPCGDGSVWTVAVNIFLLWECFRPLDFGGCCVIVRQETFVDPDAFLAAIEKYNINELLFTASYAKLFLSHHLMKAADVKGDAFSAPKCLKRVWQNGEPVTESLREAFLSFFPNPDVELLNLYSISECFEVGHGNIRTDRAEMITFPGVRIEIDESKKNEVVVFTSSIRHGYHKPSTDAEKSAFAPDMTWYRTGDVGKMLSEAGATPQKFLLDGRCSMFIRVKGRFLSLEQVEGVVERGLGLVGKGLATVEVDQETSELIAYVDGGFDSEKLPDVRALCPFPEWMPDRFVRHAPTVRRPSPSGKSNRTPTATQSGAAQAGDAFPSAKDARNAEIKRVILDHVGVDVDGLTKPMSLRDLGVSSLSILRLREALKTEAGVDMSVGELYKIADVRKFVAETFTPDMLYSEVDLIVSSTKDAPGYAGDAAADPAPRGYFITGATGFLGGWVAHTVAKSDPDAVVFILSRRSEEATREVFAKKGLTVPKNAVIVKGDTSEAGFGMAKDVIADIQKSVKYYIHCAAHVVFGCSYAEARPSTVMGANHLLTLYMGSHPAAELHYISTNGVYPPFFTRDTRRACLETQEDFPLYASRLKEGYGWSKWVAEKSVFDVCRARNRVVRAYRPGNIGWAVDGRYNPIDFQTLIVFAARALNCVPAVATWNFEMTPVDELAGFIFKNCGHPPTDGPVAHNCIGKRTPMDFYIDAAIPRVPMDEWLNVAAAYVEKHTATKGDPENKNGARDLDAVEQTRASFEEYVTLDMYLSDTNDYFTHNSLCYEPTKAYADSIV